MTSDVKATRLSKAAREFNVGISTIVEFLHKKGFSLDQNPNTKIPQEAYLLLVKEYSTDIRAKKESENLGLKGFYKKRESLTIEDVVEKEPADEQEPEEEIIVKDLSGTPYNIDIKTEVKKAEIKVVGKIDIEGLSKSRTETTAEKEQPKSDLQAEETKEPKVKETKTPQKEDPKAEKKKSKKETAKTVSKKPASEQKISEKREEVKEVVEKSKPSKPKAPEEPKVKIFRTESSSSKLSGPTVVGKIDLPVEEKKKTPAFQSTKPEGPGDSRKKKKRKRIVKGQDKPSAITTPPGEKKEKVGGKKGKKRPIRAEISEEEVQKQIKETLARLTTKGKSRGSRYRKEKRELIHQKNREDKDRLEQEKNILKVTEFVSANELAIMMDIPVTEIISTCMNLGLFVSINQRLDAETLSLLAYEFGYDIEFVSAELQEAVKEEEDREEDLLPRPPIVTVMGHVDHGKTKLLDYIRRTNVIAGEAGGITQHIGAYAVRLDNGKKITFLDTPGHEAFTAMRARGAQITDIAIIVIAADDGIMPQTVEAINHASAAGVPIVFAINKIDKPQANPEKIKEALANMNYLVEEWGGKYQSQEISAKAGLNIDILLEKVLLEAEMLDLRTNPNKPATGTIIESSLDKGRGYTATVLVKAGTLKVGDVMLAGSYYGNVKAMHNERGNKIEEIGPSTPALVLGLNGAPQAGDNFNIMESDREAKDIATRRAQLQREQGLRTQKHITLDEIGRRIAIGNFQELNIIVKGDVDGSVEALSDSLIKLSTPEIQLNVIHKAVGQISESDILLAAASNAIVVGFQVRPSLNARKLAEQEEIDIRLYSIIYDAIEEIKSAMEGMLSPEEKEEIVATLEVREVFKVSKVGSVAGCYVKEGKISRNTKVRVIRDGIVVYTGDLGSLKRFKDDVKEVNTGYECGLNIQNFNDIKVGDIIEGYKVVEVKKTL
ncbi:MAG: translation initiation factor IF-2 [Bacteroidales bacterium]|jgi:translation initiation factor IF-2|nr:translation initiation factor IF-2 [Bacteroidota bacterium]